MDKMRRHIFDPLKNFISDKMKCLCAGSVAMAAILMLSGCQAGNSQQNNDQTPNSGRVDTGFVLTGPDSFDSADTTIVVQKKKEDNSVTFLNLNRGKYYTLSMDGTTHLYDKYGESISLEQINEGDIVDITFLKNSKHMTSMQLSSDAWKNEEISRYEIDYARREVTIGEDIYRITDNTQYLSNGQRIETMDLNPSDVLTFQGLDNQVLSISVEKGHGYLRLLNDENFVGGWIEIGQSIIQRITDDMLLTVPEGSYQVNISHRGGGGIKSVVINRNEETALDIGDLEVPEVQTGIILFSISPTNAKVYIDSAETDVSGPVTLEYGIHQLIVKADGYKSITQYIRVGQASAAVNVVLESSTAGGDDTKTDVTDVSSDYYRVHIDAPEGVEVYLDGSYVGVTPCSFKKTAGAHIVTLRKTGYVTRSYTLQVDSEDKDISYSFDELEPSNSVSSNSSGSLNTDQLVQDIINGVLGEKR